MFKVDGCVVYAFEQSYAVAVATGRVFCQWHAGQSVSIFQSVVLSHAWLMGQTQSNQSGTAGSQRKQMASFFLQNSVIIFSA